MTDTVMKWFPERQGVRTAADISGEWKISERNLAQVIQMGEEAVYKRIDNARVSSELLWQHEISRALNAAVQPETYAVAERTINWISEQAGPLLAERIKTMHNALLPGGTVPKLCTSQEVTIGAENVFVLAGRLATFNTQVPNHRDGANSLLLDSVFHLGTNYQGGRLILPELGVSLCGDHGYSVHGLFRILEHGVSYILPQPGKEEPPFRISLALYSHADVFDGAAKLSAAQSGSGAFSDPSMWLPFPPPKFSLSDCRARLAREERSWKRKDKESKPDKGGKAPVASEKTD